MKKRRIISALLLFVFIIGSLPVNCMTAFADNNTVEISSAAELAALAVSVKDGNHFEGQTVKLTKDIDLSEIGNWNPIGYNLNNYFSGVFDGDFHTVYNLSYDYSIDAGNIINTPYQAVGLFGSCNNAVIKNLKLNTVTINLINSSGYHNTYSSIDGSNIYTGGLIGYAVGTTIDGVTLDNVSITGETQSEAGTCYTGGLVGYAASGTSIVYSSVGNGTINGASSSVNGNSCVGGIVGLMKDEGSIRQSYNAANINGGHSAGRASTGGIVGKMENGTVETAYITNCYNSGTLTHSGSWLETGEIGGIAGYAYGSITNCYNSGSVTANTNTVGGDVYAGGIAGNANGIAAIGNCAVVSSKISGGTKNYIISGGGTKSGNVSVSGISGSPTNDAESQFASADFSTSALFINQLGWDFSSIWSIEPGQLPKLRIKDSNNEKIELVTAALEQTYIVYEKGDDYSSVTGSISFHNPGNGCTVDWSSDNEAVVNSASGLVSAKENDCLVRVSAKIEKDGYSLTKIFVLNVIGTESTQAPEVEDWAMTVVEARNLVSLMRGCKFQQVSADDADVLVLTGQNVEEDAVAETMSKFLGFWDIPGESSYLKSQMGDVIQTIKDGADAEFDALVSDFSGGLLGGDDGQVVLNGKAAAKKLIAIPKASFKYDLSNIDLINAYSKFKSAKDFSVDENAYPMENVFDGLSKMAGVFDAILKTGGVKSALGKIVGAAENIFTSIKLFKAYKIGVQNAQKEYINAYLDLREQGLEPTDDLFVLNMQMKATADGTFKSVEDCDKLNEMCELIFRIYSKYNRSVDDSYKVIIQCPVDVFVYDSEGVLVGRVVDNTVDEGIKNSIEITLSGSENDVKTIHFQDSELYSIKLVGNDVGTMNITVDKPGSVSRQTVDYNDISLEKGKEMLMDISSSSIDDSLVYDVVDGVISDESKSADSSVTGYKLTVYTYQEDAEGVLSYLSVENVSGGGYIEEGTNVKDIIESFGNGTPMGIYTDPECKLMLTDMFMPASDLTLYVKYFINDDRIQITGQPTGMQYVLGDEPETITVEYKSDYETSVKWYTIESDGSRRQIENASGVEFIPDITEVGEKTYAAVILGVDGDETFSAITERITISVLEKQAIDSGTSGDLQWELYNNGEIVFTGNGAAESYSSKQTPWYQYAQDITKVTFDGNVAKIGGYMFEDCSKIQSLTIPDSVTEIEEYAFNGCVGLTELTIPFVGASRTAQNTYDAVLGYAFGRTNEDGINQFFEFSDGSLSGYVYAIPASLEKVTVTDAPSIALGAFSNCTSLKEIILGNTTAELKDFILYGIDSLERFEIQNRNCSIIDNYNTFSISGTIYGYSLSTAESFASGKNILFVLLDEEHVHIWDDGENTKEATCNDEGVKTFTCTVCGCTKTETVEKTAHIPEVMSAVAATCKTTGLTEGIKCAVCGEILSQQESVPKTDHIWNDGENTKEASCNEEGIKTFTCTVCGDKKTDLIKAVGHKYGLWIIVRSPSCTAEGLEQRVCSNDGNHTETRTVAKAAHADADNDGFCDNCGSKIETAKPDVLESNCACGRCHTGPFAGIIRFFHLIIYFFKNLFSEN